MVLLCWSCAQRVLIALTLGQAIIKLRAPLFTVMLRLLLAQEADQALEYRAPPRQRSGAFLFGEKNGNDQSVGAQAS